MREMNGNFSTLWMIVFLVSSKRAHPEGSFHDRLEVVADAAMAALGDDMVVVMDAVEALVVSPGPMDLRLDTTIGTTTPIGGDRTPSSHVQNLDKVV